MRSLRAALLLTCIWLASPSEAKAPELSLQYERVALTNGLTLIVNEDHSSPLVTVHVWYRVGSRDEAAGQSGLAHLFEHLMFNGSEHYDAEWFAPLLEVGGTAIGGETSHDHTVYHETVPTAALDRVLWMEADRMANLLGALTQSKLDEQRGVIENEIRENENAPFGRLDDRVTSALFPPGHPYHQPVTGSIADLRAASLPLVREWFETYYRPNNAMLVLSGDIDVAAARAKVTEYFAPIPAGPQPDRWARWAPTRDHDSRDIQYDNVSAPRVKRAWVVPGRATRDHALLSLAAAVLGEGRNGRLPAELVYRRQLATMAFATVSYDELAGQFVMWADLKPDADASVATEAMDRLVSELIARGPTPAELERAISTATSNIVSGVSDGNGRAGALAAGELYAGDPAFLNRYLAWIDAAKASDVREAARAYLAKGWHQTEVQPRRSLASAPENARPPNLPAVPSQLPAVGFPPVTVSLLENGARLVVAERHNAPHTFVSIQFDAGNAADPAGKPGTAAFAADLLDEGTRSRSAAQIAAETARLGATLSTFSDLDSSGVTLMALSSRLGDSLRLWADVVQNAALADAQIERVRASRVAAIGSEQADPQSMAFRILRSQSFGKGHGYAIPRSGLSDAASIRAITREDLLMFRRAWLRPDNATIFVAGATTLGQVEAVLNRAFRGWRAPAVARPEKRIAAVPRQTTPRLILVDRPGSPQSLILGGDVAPASGAANELAIELANSILGGQFTSRLNMNLRETRHWSYGVSSGMADARGQRSFQINAPVETDRTAQALAELIGELRAINGERPISETELAAAKANAVRQLPGAFEHAGAVLASLQTSAALGRPFDYPNSLAQRYDALTLEDVRAAAREVIHPQSMIWIVVGDRGRIESQVAALDIARIEHWTADGRATE